MNENLKSQAFFLFKKAPLLKFLFPLIMGIVGQYFLLLTLLQISTILGLCIALYCIWSCLSIRYKFVMQHFASAIIWCSCLFLGALISFLQNGANSSDSILKNYVPNNLVWVTIDEPLVEKENSYKAIAKVYAIKKDSQWTPVSGKILLYFKKDSLLTKHIVYGSEIILTGNLQLIQNAGNPGGFNYKAYSAFQNIYYQAFLQPNQFLEVGTIKTNWLHKWLYNTRQKVINTLQKYILHKNEQSIAAALLIGYRNDLDRDLVQAYSNTGIVHIIAISGLHLGLIYGLLLFLFKPFEKFRWIHWLKPICILLVIWLFTLLAGAVPSILRSAVMFTCIVIGNVFNKRSNIYNMLAASACIILLFQPFSLWDVGFQLSYAAVLSIIMFSKSIENWLYTRNKLLQLFSKLLAVTLSAQILTMPFLLYHFHQLPTLFLFTNILAVPISTVVLYGLILLILVSLVFHSIAHFLGTILEQIIWAMNDFVLTIHDLPFATIGGIYLSIFQIVLLYAFIFFTAYWLLYKNTKSFVYALVFCAAFLGIRFVDFISKIKQHYFIVYNVPKHTAIDVIDGRKFCFLGDSILLQNGFLRNFHLQPSRVKHRLNAFLPIDNMLLKNNVFFCNNKTILILDEMPVVNEPFYKKIDVDVIVITKNPTIYLEKLNTIFNCKQYVFDASNSFRKIGFWKNDAKNLKLSYHVVAENGAFVYSL